MSRRAGARAVTIRRALAGGRAGERIEWVADDGRLAEVASAWDRLAAGAGDPFMTEAWLAAWRGAFARPTAGVTPRVCLAWRGSQLVGGLPLLATPGGLRAMVNDHTPSFRPIAADRAGLRAVVAAALHEAGGVLVLPRLPADHPLVTARGGWRALQSPDTVSPLVDTSGTFAAWRALTSPRWRTPIERLARKMAREHDATLRLVAPAEDLAATLAAGFALEASGWKGRAGTAIASSADTAEFYRAVAAAFDARGQLRVSTIELDGELVAFSLCLLHGCRLWQLKIAFSERHRSLAPGLVLHLKAIERCFALRLAAYELLGDRAEWKGKFATSDRDFVRLTVYAARPWPAARYMVRRAGRAARALRKRAGGW